MLAFIAPSGPKKVVPNLLPCSIKHNGLINAAPRYWSPILDSPDSTNGTERTDRTTSTAYFRGRKLRGRKIAIAEGYQGVILQKIDECLPTEKEGTKKNGSNGGIPTAEDLRRMEEERDGHLPEDADVDEEFEEDKALEVKMMRQESCFDEMVVWGHEMVPEDEDVYVKGIEEWIGFAEAMHSYDKPADQEASAGKPAT